MSGGFRFRRESGRGEAMPFESERRAFAVFRAGLEKNAQLRDEYLAATRAAVGRYNTSVYENRFVVGGVIERLTAAALRAAGVSARMVGAETTGVDIALAGGGSLSVKAQLAAARGEYRLINTMGDSPAMWTSATLFIAAGAGIGYGDPDLLGGAIVRRKDVVVLPWRPLNQMWRENPDCFIRLDIPTKPSGPASESRIASETIAAELVRELNLPLLRECL